MKVIKIIIAVLLLLCLLKMPYGYYQFVRVVSFVGFLCFAYQSYKNGNKILPFLYFGLALMFQPFAKIVMQKHTWNTIDVIVALFLIISLFFQKD
jgi:hypothetical protein